MRHSHYKYDEAEALDISSKTKFRQNSWIMFREGYPTRQKTF